MDTLINMDPWNLIDDILGVRNNAFKSMRARAAGRFPPANVYLDDDAAIIDLRLPGKNAKNVELTLEPQAAIVRDKAAEGATPAWSRRIELPFRVDAAKANAKFANGILRIELPKAEADGVRRIAIA